MRGPRELSGVGGLVPQEKKTTFLNSYIEITKMKCSSLTTPVQNKITPPPLQREFVF